MMATTKPKTKYVPPTNPPRRWVFFLVMSDTFDNLMILIILSNVFVMFLTHQGQSEAWDIALNGANIAFTGAYVLEMLLKWTAIGLPLYFKVRVAWNALAKGCRGGSLGGGTNRTPASILFPPLSRHRMAGADLTLWLLSSVSW